MDYFSRAKIPLLVVEDNDAHYNAIKQVLTASGDCSVERLKASDPEQLYNYKAAHPTSQLVIVDLELGKRLVAGYEGLQVIKFLQRADKTTFFVIYSVHDQPSEIRLDAPTPDWTYVQKEVDASKNLTAKSLDWLSLVIEEYKKWCAPAPDMPAFDTMRYNRELLDYANSTDVPAPRLSTHASEAIQYSANLLRRVAIDCLAYSRAGREMESIGIGVFGSCGRMEMRPDSDVELSVYYLGADRPEMREIASIVWNRATSFIASKKWEYEGEALIKGRIPRCLHADQVESVVPKQGYVPAIAVELLNSDFAKHPQLRDRHLQMLTELRAVYNPRFMAAVKRSLIRENIRGAIPNVAAIFEDAHYFPSLLEQFNLDTKKRRVATWKDVKGIVYRTLNILSTRVLIISLLSGATKRLAEEQDWEWLFEELSAPGVVKLVRVFNELKANAKASAVDGLVEKLKVIVADYAFLLAELLEAGRTAKAGAIAGTAPIPGYIAPRAREILTRFVELFEAAAQSKHFASTAQHARWLFETAHLADMSNKIEGP